MAPPPPPPPPPPLQSSGSVLSSGWRSSTDSYRKIRPTISPAPESPVAWLDAQTLQHAVANLRKTEHNRSLWLHSENLSNGELDGKNQQLSRRYRPNGSVNDPLESNKTRDSVHASTNGTSDAVPVSNVHRHADSMNNESRIRQQFQKNYSSSPSINHYSVYEHESKWEENINGPYIKEPQAYIRRYATQMPAYTAYNDIDSAHVDPTNCRPSSTKFATKFAREIRDQGLTRNQRIANAAQQSVLKNTEPPSSLHSLYQQKRRMEQDQIDMLVRDMEWQMRTGAGFPGDYNCCKCGEGITREKPGCTALDQTFHVACFTCAECEKPLAGGSFYNVGGKTLCESDYKNTLERCTGCGEPIMDKLLRASGGSYHPFCFVCTVCNKCLDGVPFTMDSTNQIHCVNCFHENHAPRCTVCTKPIIPEDGEKESVRVVAMDKSFHVNCYRCEDCNLLLSSKMDGHGCYPLDQHLYCKNCNGKRLTALSAAT